MKFSMDENGPTLETLTRLIAQSPIALAPAVKLGARLPAGFDAVDAEILDWIAAEGRRLGRSFVRM